MDIYSGSKYEIMAQIIVIDGSTVHYQEVPMSEGFVPKEKKLGKEQFDKLFVKQGNTYSGYYRVDGINNDRVYLTPINRGGVPIGKELVLSMTECQGIFHQIDQTPSLR